MTTAITARSATDLLSLVPYLLGFHADDSVVVLICDEGTVEVAVRFDHWMFDTPFMVQARLAHMANRFTAPRFFLASFGADHDKGEEVLAILEQVLDPDEVIDSVYTDGERWWSRVCDRECCQGVPCDPATAVAVSAVLAGSSALASRQVLERSVEGPSLVDQSSLLGTYCEAQELVAAQPTPESCIERALELVVAGVGSADLGTPEACELAALVAEIPVRDEAWLEMGQASARQHVALWQRVVSVIPDGWAVPPLCLLAAAAWLDGNGALMGCAMARAEKLDPEYSMLDVLKDIHLAAAPPSMWSGIREVS